MIKLKPAAKTRGMSPGEAAAYWVVRQDRGGLGVREETEFAAWLDYPVNASAYGKAQDALSVFEAATDIDCDLHLRAMRRTALATTAPRRHERRAILAASLAGVSVALMVTFTYLDKLSPHPIEGPAAVPAVSMIGGPARVSEPVITPVDYTTLVGQQRTLRLEDGSRIVMNTRSQIEVAYTQGRRLVRLLRGQALFDVAHDASRPFSVEAAGRRTTALGTLFDVRVDQDRLQVVLARGKVVVERQDEPGTPVADADYLTPGQELVAERGGGAHIARVDVVRSLSWRDGFVEFLDEPLSSAVAEINRYTVHPILLSGDGVSRLHISGVFRTDDAKNFIDSVSRLLPIRVEQTAQGRTKLSLAQPTQP